MDVNNLNPSPEELEKLIKKAQEDLQAALEKMTPEERMQAEQKAKELIEADKASMQKMIDDAQKALSDSSSEKKEKPNFCPNCGAAAEDGKFCTYCGSPL